jgi:flagellar biogenesis protein FliO
MEGTQQVLAVFLVLSLLGGALYWLRTKGIARFGVAGVRRASTRRMQSLERLPLTPQHSLHLVSVAGRVMLIAISPSGCSVLDGSGWQIDSEDRAVSR